MLRMCTTSHLQPLLGGWRCPVPKEPKRNLSSKKSSKSLPNLSDSAQNANGRQMNAPKQQPEVNVQSSFQQSRMRHCNRRDMLDFNGLLPKCQVKTSSGNQLRCGKMPVQPTWYGSSRRMLDRLKVLIYEKAISTYVRQSEQVHDCREPTSAKSSIFSIENKPQSKILDVKQYCQPNYKRNIQENFANKEMCKRFLYPALDKPFQCPRCPVIPNPSKIYNKCVPSGNGRSQMSISKPTSNYQTERAYFECESCGSKSKSSFAKNPSSCESKNIPHLPKTNNKNVKSNTDSNFLLKTCPNRNKTCSKCDTKCSHEENALCCKVKSMPFQAHVQPKNNKKPAPVLPPTTNSVKLQTNNATNQLNNNVLKPNVAPLRKKSVQKPRPAKKLIMTVKIHSEEPCGNKLAYNESPLASFPFNSHKELDKLANYTKHMQNQNNIRNQKRKLGIDQTLESNIIKKNKAAQEKANKLKKVDPSKLHLTHSIEHLINMTLLRRAKSKLQDPDKFYLDIPKTVHNCKTAAVVPNQNRVQFSQVVGTSKHDAEIASLFNEALANYKHIDQQNLEDNLQSTKYDRTIATTRKIKHVHNDILSEIENIGAGLEQIDAIIKHCARLKTQFIKRYEIRCAKELHNISTDSPALFDANLSPKECRTDGQEFVQKARVTKENVNKTNKAKNTRGSTTDRTERTWPKAGIKIRSSFKLIRKSAGRNKECEFSKEIWDSALEKRFQEAKNKKMANDIIDETQTIAAERKRQEMKHQTQLEQRRIKRAAIENKYREAKKRVAELEQELGIEQTYNKGKSKDITNDNNDNDDNLNITIISPRPRICDAILMTPSWNYLGPSIGSTLDSIPMGIVDSGGAKDATAMPSLARRLDTKLYLMNMQSHLALANKLLQSQSAVADGSTADAQSAKRSENGSILYHWIHKFAQLPLQLRPGSNILLPLPHSKGGYIIGGRDSQPLSMWPDLAMEQDSEYDEPEF